MSLPTHKIGNDDVTAIGFGLMGLSAFYGAIENDEERFKVLDTAVELGCTNWDSADIYGDNEDLIGKWFKRTGKRNEIFLATKFGVTPQGPNGKPDYVRSACEKSLKRLGIDTIDLYYLHVLPIEVPIVTTVSAMAELVKQGKVRYLGLSEISAATLRRAHAVHPITAVQVEYSPFFLDIEDERIGLLKACRELDIAVVAYSPLGRGMLTGTYKSNEAIPADDWRKTIPRFNNDNFPNILKLVDDFQEIGKKHNATAGQVALAWLLAQGNDIVPIPGTKKIKYLKENLDALKVKLSSQEVNEIRSFAERANKDITGDRYPTASMGYVFADTPER
ncbi:NADP-dependent oxidoreductase domain-containing protein [Panaeolus papilionaceus]|nr:NADP-dependent oxidoreductase domain-containing protein [Panaeolus papilionaceus]